MSFITGIAANHNALIDDLQAYLTGTGNWVNEEYSPANLDAKTIDSVAAGGTGYAVSDTITLTGGTFTVATVLTVLTLSGSAVATASITTPGTYTVAPADPVLQGSTSGSGTGATFNMTYDRVTTDLVTLSLRGVGSGVNGRVYININTVKDEGNDFWGWQFYGATNYVASTPFGSMPGAGGPAYFNLWDESISYWFYQNDRRFIVIAKVSSNYMSMYGGFMLPHALDTEYPFPLCLIGSYHILEAPGLSRASNSMISDPGEKGAAWYRRRTTETWSLLENQDDLEFAIKPAQNLRAFVWPHKTGQTSGFFVNDPDNWNSGGMDNMKTNNSGESILVQAHVIDVAATGGTVVGALEGVYSTTGFGRSVEQIVTNSGQNYRLFQRAFRTTPADFFAVEEV